MAENVPLIGSFMTTTLALRLPGLLEEPSCVHHTSQSRSETDTTCFIPFVWRRILVISIHSMHRSVRSYFLSSLVEGLFHSFGSWSIHFTSSSWRVSTSYPPKLQSLLELSNLIGMANILVVSALPMEMQSLRPRHTQSYQPNRPSRLGNPYHGPAPSPSSSFKGLEKYRIAQSFSRRGLEPQSHHLLLDHRPP